MKAYLTVVETVYYQPLDQQPVSVESRYTHGLARDAEPVLSQREATDQWQALETGGLDGPAVFVLRNEEGEFRYVRPSEEEQQAVAAKVIEVGRGGAADWLVPPGASMRGLAAQPGHLQVRCQTGTAKFTLTLFGA